MIRLLKTAVARIQDAQAAMPSDLDGMACDLGDLDELLGVLSSYTRRLSSAVESLPDLTEDLRVNEQDGPVPPQLVCNQIAIHTQAACKLDVTVYLGSGANQRIDTVLRFTIPIAEHACFSFRTGRTG